MGFIRERGLIKDGTYKREGLLEMGLTRKRAY